MGMMPHGQPGPSQYGGDGPEAYFEGIEIQNLVDYNKSAGTKLI